jgi:uncharacterized protein
MSDQDDVIAFLANRASYGLKSAVERVDTHASSVFLAGERAYKLKRAVRFSYLDYSTLTLREAACRAEFELNRRIAPKLYLGVRAIRRRENGKLGFDGAGAILDWVVEMRRFEAENLFDQMAGTRRLTPALMRELADVIAGFHAAAEPHRDAGGAAAMGRIIDGNVENLRFAATPFDQEMVDRLDAAARTALHGVATLLDRRREQGKVRRCHGDLHLGNICLLDRHPTLFDAVEFNDEIARIDVLYDLAFLLMDLANRKLHPLASIVFNRYLDLAPDEAGLPALPLFLSLRAVIRAHVSAAAAQRQSSDAEFAKRNQASLRYLTLGAQLLELGAPRLIAVGGASGSGKSTIAAALAPDLMPVPGARILRSDVLRKRLLDLPPEARLPPDAYSHAMGKRIYAKLHHDAAQVLAAGYCVILDATFLDPEERRAAAQLAERAGVPFTGLWLEARREVMAQRIAERKGDASDATVAVLDQQLAGDPGPIDWKRVSTGGALPRVLAQARRAVGTGPPE